MFLAPYHAQHSHSRTAWSERLFFSRWYCRASANCRVSKSFVLRFQHLLVADMIISFLQVCFCTTQPTHTDALPDTRSLALRRLSVPPEPRDNAVYFFFPTLLAQMCAHDVLCWRSCDLIATNQCARTKSYVFRTSTSRTCVPTVLIHKHRISRIEQVAKLGVFHVCPDFRVYFERTARSTQVCIPSNVEHVLRLSAILLAPSVCRT